ncbi:MAG: UDP-N-acetylmuramoyl-tripeptide--D-alanyl-D-alanine ligase [Spirochaetaceae bacterium]|nr:UDP-N-acetylmuramoyl-tripeptide--D-alanyl-D-alanine ligase [Spirochaetaceae bacterium]
MTVTTAALAGLTGARLVGPGRGPLAAAQVPLRRVVVDSRAAGADTLFVALAGSRADGHDFLADAFAAGAAAALIARRQWRTRRAELQAVARRYGATLAVVDDPLQALHRLAEAHRSHSEAERVAVTGSSGKTTTRRILASILKQCTPTYEAERNYNSVIGLPLALLGIERRHRMAVLELGIDYRGEMDELGRLAAPHHALITGIGTAHLAAFESRRTVAAEKARVLAYLPRGGYAFVPEGEELLALSRLPLAPEVALVQFGPTKTKGYEGSESLGLDGSTIHWEGLQIHFPLFGNHNVANVLAAITVASTLRVSAAAIRHGIEAVEAVAGRSQVIRGRLTIINDAYNANPESMAAALTFVAELPGRGRVLVVLGSMLELGTATRAAHAALAEVITAAAPDAVFLFGAETAATADALQAAGFGRPLLWTKLYEELETAVVASVRPGDTVLLKGSRGVALDRLVEPLQAA